MGKRGVWITPETWDKFERLVAEGNTIKGSAQRCGISENSGRNRVKAMREAGQVVVQAPRKPTAVGWSNLNDRAQRGWDDFEYFRRVYFGHISTPWQVTAAEELVAALEDPNETFFIWNMPPRAGKSTLTVDIAAWATVRNRAIRGLFGSLTATNAEKQTRRLAEMLTWTIPYKAKARDKKLGLACDAESTLAADYGLFKPQAADSLIWRADQFTVVQEAGRVAGEREATWTSYGKDSGFLGNGFDLIFWDDVEDRSTCRTEDIATEQRLWWDDKAETRLDPGGVMLLVGQRIASNDLYRYNLDKARPLDIEEEIAIEDMEDEAEQEAARNNRPKWYRHQVFKAHDEENCKGREFHRIDAPAYPDGCLLDPRRITWSKVSYKRANDPRGYAILFQQEDANPADVLVRREWVYGGIGKDDFTNEPAEFPGCVDRDRGLWTLPKNIHGDVYYFGTIDPSVRKNWAIQVWAYAPDHFNQLILLNTVRKSMTTDELLFQDGAGQHHGILEDFQANALRLGMPISHWVIERSLTMSHFHESHLERSWTQKWTQMQRPFGVSLQVIPHTTTKNKHDPTYGIDMVRDWWRSGRIRLPFTGGDAAMASLKLIEEVIRYPNAGTDDQVMAHWFGILHLPEIARRIQRELPRQHRPSVVSMLPDGRNLSLVGAR